VPVKIGIFCHRIDVDTTPDGWLPRSVFSGASQWLLALFGPIIRFFTLHPEAFSRSAAEFLTKFMIDPVIEGIPSLIEFIKGKVRLGGDAFHSTLENPKTASDLLDVLVVLLDAFILNGQRDDLELDADGDITLDKRGQKLPSLPTRLWAVKSKRAASWGGWAFHTSEEIKDPAIDLLLGITEGDDCPGVLLPPMIEPGQGVELVYVSLPLP
jgi:hypothetical protein